MTTARPTSPATTPTATQIQAGASILFRRRSNAASVVPALLLADCCYSGCLADAVSQQARRIAYACAASSLASELSTGNWTFTEGLLAGLRGQAFVDADS